MMDGLDKLLALQRLRAFPPADAGMEYCLEGWPTSLERQTADGIEDGAQAEEPLLLAAVA